MRLIHTKTRLEIDYSWIYFIIFLIIPLARIIPRILRKYNINLSETRPQQMSFSNTKSNLETPQDDSFETRHKETKPQTNQMRVLGALNNGCKTFESIQKNVKLDSKQLDVILQELEENDMLQIRQKQGLMGNKVNLYPTEKGFKEYYS